MEEIRNPKFEIRNNFQNSNDQMFKACFDNLDFLSFEFVSNFGFRNSNLKDHA